jgi:hypothetical protein
MMDVLPPKWTELFQHQHEQDRVVNQQQDRNKNTAPRRSCQWHSSTHYNTYQACTIHPTHDPHHHHLPHSPRKFRTHSYSSNPSIKEPPSLVNKEGETQLRGTRFRLAKATIRIDDEDEEQQHQELNNNDSYV